MRTGVGFLKKGRRNSRQCVLQARLLSHGKAKQIFQTVLCLLERRREFTARIFLPALFPDEYLFDPALGSAFYRYLKWLYKWAYLEPAPGQRTQ